MNKNNQGFTLIEIMIVVAIIAILAAVAIPNFIKYRDESQKSSCISNMKQIQTAAEQWLITNGATATPAGSDLYGADKYIKTKPVCPFDKVEYSIANDSGVIKVTCGQAASKGHVIPNEGAEATTSD